MSDKEKFEGFKKELIEKNEKKYGAEIRGKYGNDMVEESNVRLMGLSEEQYNRMQELGEEIQALLEESVRNHEYVEDEIGEKVAMLHKEWLGFTWPTYRRRRTADSCRCIRQTKGSRFIMIRMWKDVPSF